MGTVIEFSSAAHQEDLLLRHLLRSLSEEHGIPVSLESPELQPYLEGLRCFVKAYAAKSKLTVYGFQPEQADAVKAAMDKARQQLFADTLMVVLESAGLLRRKHD